jgi:chemotaxis protein CheX
MTEAESAAVQLAPMLDLTAATPLAAQLLELRGRDLRIDAAQVQRLGGQCLQVLLSAEQTWRADGASFAIEAPSERFLADWRLFGGPEALVNPNLASCAATLGQPHSDLLSPEILP